MTYIFRLYFELKVEIAFRTYWVVVWSAWAVEKPFSSLINFRLNAFKFSTKLTLDFKMWFMFRSGIFKLVVEEMKEFKLCVVFSAASIDAFLFWLLYEKSFSSPPIFSEELSPLIANWCSNEYDNFSIYRNKIPFSIDISFKFVLFYSCIPRK